MVYIITEEVIDEIKKLQQADKKKIRRVLENIEKAETIQDIPNVIKVKGTQKKLYRIKITPYRIFFIEVSKVIKILSIERL